MGIKHRRYLRFSVARKLLVSSQSRETSPDVSRLGGALGKTRYQAETFMASVEHSQTGRFHNAQNDVEGEQRFLTGVLPLLNVFQIKPTS